LTTELKGPDLCLCLLKEQKDKEEVGEAHPKSIEERIQYDLSGLGLMYSQQIYPVIKRGRRK
jgi:hypothetical protein